MNLNTIVPALGSNRPVKRIGRGIGSGSGKTSGRGHKGQKSRAGGFHKRGFEGGQMPLQRRLPKVGFSSLNNSRCAELRLGVLSSLKSSVIDLSALKSEAIVSRNVINVKIINSGTLTTPITIKGLRVTKGAKTVIEKIGGRIED